MTSHPTPIKTEGAIESQHATWRAARGRLGMPLVGARQVPVRLPGPRPVVPLEAKFGAPIDFYAAPSMKFILKVISLKSGLSAKEIMSTDRSRRVMDVRHEAAFMIHTHTRRSFPDIGVFFGGRDHTTIMASAATFMRKNPDKAWLREALDAEKAASAAETDRAIEEMLERDYSVTSIRRTTGVSIPRILAVEAAWLARGAVASLATRG